MRTDRHQTRTDTLCTVLKLAYKAMIIALLAICLIKLDNLAVMATDNLNQAMYIRQEIGGQEEVATNNWLVYALDAEEQDLIERVVAAEARGESYEGMLAVCQTIRDRAYLWGMTPTEIVTAKGQFAKPYQGEINDSIKLAVKNSWQWGQSAFDGYVTHFHEASIEPYWTKGKTCLGQIGNHTFWY